MFASPSEGGGGAFSDFYHAMIVGAGWADLEYFSKRLISWEFKHTTESRFSSDLYNKQEKGGRRGERREEKEI